MGQTKRIGRRDGDKNISCCLVFLVPTTANQIVRIEIVIVTFVEAALLFSINILIVFSYFFLGTGLALSADCHSDSDVNFDSVDSVDCVGVSG